MLIIHNPNTSVKCFLAWTAFYLAKDTLNLRYSRHIRYKIKFHLYQFRNTLKLKPPQVVLRGLLSDRQQSILPGRFQPSTFDAWELNCCVRDGNRWGLPAIVTGSLNRLFAFPPRQACVSLARHTSVCLRGARWPFLAASTKILVHAFRSFQTLKTLQKKLLAKN